jgi:alpha-galactosidase
VGGNAWRTTWDIEDSWDSVVKIGFAQSPYAGAAGPGHWNDPDTLVVGRLGWGAALHPSRLSPDEQYSQLSLWSLLAAPLLIGNDLSAMDAFTLNLLTNDEVIAINQDPLGRAAQRVWQEDDWQVWVKELEGGRRAVGVFNLGAQLRTLKLTPAMLGGSAPMKVRDAWRQRDLGSFPEGLAVSAPAHGVGLLVVN